MVALLIFRSVLAVSFLVTRVATRLFMLTGLSQEAARFQTRSIITGTGFTTREAEHIVDHPVRRRISLTLSVVNWGNQLRPPTRLRFRRRRGGAWDHRRPSPRDSRRRSSRHAGRGPIRGARRQ
ncbi:MAG: hypothetical protein ABEL97_13455 [Salinibacter sp.]